MGVARFLLICLVVALGALRYILHEPLGDSSFIDLTHLSPHKRALYLQRNAEQQGVFDVWAHGDQDLALGLGYAHAKDRFMQLFFVRAIIRGELSQHFASTDETFEVDRSVRGLGFHWRVQEEEKLLTPNARAILQAYANGINARKRERFVPPLGFILTGNHDADAAFRDWEVSDCLIMTKFLGFSGLASAQGDFEKWVLSVAQQGAQAKRKSDADYSALKILRAVMSPLLDDVLEEKEFVELIATKLHVGHPFHQANFAELQSYPMPTLKGSNNWAVGGKRSASGAPMYASDPHLDIARLPNFWYEASLHDLDTVGSDGLATYNMAGFSIPGMPGMLIARTNDVAFGLTYGFQDQTDLWAEECRGTACRGVNDPEGVFSVPLKLHTERIQRKGDTPVDVVFAETENGILDLSDEMSSLLLSQPQQGLPRGFYLSTRWSGQTGTPHGLNSYLNPKLSRGTDATEMRKEMKFEISLNFIFVDKKGNMAYQQTGSLPVRAQPKKPALTVRKGWLAADRWAGVDPSPNTLHHEVNPQDGILATCNNNINPNDGPLTVTLHMGDARCRRIRELLKATPKHTAASFSAIHVDTFSDTAYRYLKTLRPLLPAAGASVAADALRQWDARYDVDSKGVAVFETLYAQLHAEVFSDVFAGWGGNEGVFKRILMEQFHHFDDFLLGEASITPTEQFDPALLWARQSSGSSSSKASTREDFQSIREAVFRRVLERVLSQADAAAAAAGGELQTYAQMPNRTIPLNNVFFSGKLPGAQLFGLDYKPIPFPGGRDTVLAGQTFWVHGRQDSFCPSLRLIADLATDVVNTIIPGGISDGVFSGMYDNQVEQYRRGETKVVQLRRRAPRESHKEL